ncbi:chemotaxis protein CheB [bacterium SCSIO 12696]|nr:chemotaxis protein CheB [bacterium SCSIO 12696]
MAVQHSQTVIAIGASTGGTEAIRLLLKQLPDLQAAPLPPIVVTQHIDPGFAKALAASLNKSTALSVSLAEEGKRLQAGHVYLAPGDRHLVLSADQMGYCCHLSAEPPRNKCRPSVDVMFESLAEGSAAHIVAVLLTGMGRDGAQGLLTLRQQGAYTLAQDEASSVVWGMPGEAVRVNAAIDVVPLAEVATAIRKQINDHKSSS